MTSQNEFVVENDRGSTTKKHKEGSSNITSLIQQELLKLLKGKMISEANCAEFTGFTGNVAANPNSSLIHNKCGNWLVDTDTTSHMCFDQTML